MFVPHDTWNKPFEAVALLVADAAGFFFGPSWDFLGSDFLGADLFFGAVFGSFGAGKKL